MEITMARGDLEIRTFQIRSPSGTGGGTVPFTGQLDEIYLTVKKTHNDSEYKFQKRLSDTTIVPLGNGEYQFRIEPEDTDGLMFGTYEFDIELIIAGELKKTFCGKLNLMKEITYAENEVSV